MNTRSLLDIISQTLFRFLLHLPEICLRIWIIDKIVQLAQLMNIATPSVTNPFINGLRQMRGSDLRPSTLHNTVSFIVKLFWRNLVEVAQSIFLKQLGMQLCHTVYTVTADNSQMRHMDLVIAYDARIFDGFVVNTLSAHPGDITIIDFHNNLVDARQNIGEQARMPLLQCFRQNRMIRIAHGLACCFPRNIPFQTVIVDENAHKLRRSHSRMRIVNMHRNFLVNTLQRQAHLQIRLNNGLQTCRSHKILLHKAQLLTLIGGIVWVEHGRNIFYTTTIFNRWIVQFVFFRNFYIPQAQIIHYPVAEADLRHIVWHSTQNLRVIVHRLKLAISRISHIHVTEEAHVDNIVVFARLPHIANRAEPGVWKLHLIAVNDTLLKQAITVAQTIAETWITGCGQGIHKGCSQTT